MAAGLGSDSPDARPEPAARGRGSPTSVIARSLDLEALPAPRNAPASPMLTSDPLAQGARRGEEKASPVANGLDAEAPREGRVSPEPESLTTRAPLPKREDVTARAPVPKEVAPRSPADVPRSATPVLNQGVVPSSSRDSASPFSEVHEPAAFEAAPTATSVEAIAPVRGAAPVPERARSAVQVKATSASDESDGRPAASPRGPSVPVQAERVVSSPLPTAPESAPTQVVQVTIGRIEVRAATPPAPARPAPARQSSALSLDEYLRRRNGGGR
ncbi:hypothetical protein JY651_22935 [Pyxidicoccus parkwayensis]|uniref:Uncharacterized protein n=1 Tax=Pyxidicoccus parkwayensis TaxID=2813578 RepID=A0ABX7PAP2_9BACT|nr:hypothetical protein [Pyxidicoccus parkwaysis]QSQ27593.1 hypothetical protein JY651_22935 [Pyxidicoccus parkwaysis]